jgi:hypothetical protein
LRLGLWCQSVQGSSRVHGQEPILDDHHRGKALIDAKFTTLTNATIECLEVSAEGRQAALEWYFHF